MVPPLLTRLRAATQELHLDLERTPCMARLQAEDLGREDVVRVLRVLGAGFALLEPTLRGLPWYRPQGPAITADLEWLGAEPASDLSASLPADAVAGALGTAYVLIGSRLGAKSIRRQLAARLGPEFVDASAYYGSEEAYAKTQWAALTAALASDAHDEAREVAAGIGAFRLLRDLAQQADPMRTR